MAILCVIVFAVLIFTASAGSPNYLIGTAITDVTGPAAQVNMMGYANMDQNTAGIHIRLYSRAFIISDLQKQNRFVFVSVDIGMVSQLIKLEVVRRLNTKFGNLYKDANICLSGTHTHSGPGGFHQYVLYGVTSLGFVKENFDAIVNGIVTSIEEAHVNMKPGNIFVNEGDIVGSNINRSPSAYLNNPEKERARYKGNTDTLMTMLKIVDENNKPMGMINWFAVHPTSMNNTNDLISGDNKGYASQMVERVMNPGSLPGMGSFVAAFAQTNLGDVSPNTRGPHCQDSGLPCDILSSTCHGKSELCVASGPGKNMFDSTHIIGSHQVDKAMELFKDATTPVKGPVDFRHQYLDMSNVNVKLNETHTVRTCAPAMGFSFAAGTTDGPGAFDFKQGDTKGNPFWNLIRDLIAEPSPAQMACHAPKPILLDTGNVNEPYGIPWQPKIIPLQILRIGQLVIVAVPGEFTTMSGRRLREAVKQTLISKGFPAETKVVIAGLANTYTSYIATYEEYQIQRYEGASTIYGPHTLSAYLQEFTAMASAMATGVKIPVGPTPPNLYTKQIGFLPGVVFDCAPLFKEYGSVLVDAEPAYKKGSVVKVEFVSANPRNDLRIGGTFLTVERKLPNGQWKVEFTDANWETRYYVIRESILSCKTNARIEWAIPAQQPNGLYRIRHFGKHKNLITGLSDFEGSSRIFQVTSSDKLMFYRQSAANKLRASKYTSKTKSQGVWSATYGKYDILR